MHGRDRVVLPNVVEYIVAFGLLNVMSGSSPTQVLHCRTSGGPPSVTLSVLGRRRY